MVNSFLELSKVCVRKEGFIYISPLAKKVCFCRENHLLAKNIIYRYLEEKWTYSYIDKLDQFVNTINSRFNRVTKLAPNKNTKKDVPRLVSLSAQTSILQKPKFYIGDFVRYVKKNEAFSKGYKQSFTDEVFEITDIATLSPPTNSIIDANKKIEGNFYQPEFKLVRERSK